MFTIHILLNISRSKGNQTMQFCQLIDMRNTFIEKLIKSGAEASPRPFYKNSNLSMSLDQQSEML